jgi:hypothetical protein
LNGYITDAIEKAPKNYNTSKALEEVNQIVNSCTRGNVMAPGKEVVNVDQLTQRLEMMRLTKKGSVDRLQQAFGKQGASDLLNALGQAQTKQMSLQAVHNILTKVLKVGTGLAVTGLIGKELLK